MFSKQLSRAALVAATAVLCVSTIAAHADDNERACKDLPNFAALKSALIQAVAAESSGLNNQVWVTLVNRDGVVCAVAFSGVNRGAQWPGSRVISAQKANTANAFGLDPSSNSNGSGQPEGLALSTANLYSAVQPGGSLFGLQFSNPVDTNVAYGGQSFLHGTAFDPMVGNKIGGVNVFGGGLGLYATGHKIAWRVRNILGLDHMAANQSQAAVPGPASLFASDPTHPDNIIFDVAANPNGGTGNSASGFGHPS